MKFSIKGDTKSAEIYGFGHVYCGNHEWKTSLSFAVIGSKIHPWPDYAIPYDTILYAILKYSLQELFRRSSFEGLKTNASKCRLLTTHLKKIKLTQMILVSEKKY